MPPYTVINPQEETLNLPYGDFEPDVLYRNVELTNPQLRNAINQRGLVVLDEAVSVRDIARTAFTLLGALDVSGFRTPAEREQTRLRGSLQDWQNLLHALGRAD